MYLLGIAISVGFGFDTCFLIKLTPVLTLLHIKRIAHITANTHPISRNITFFVNMVNINPTVKTTYINTVHVNVFIFLLFSYLMLNHWNLIDILVVSVFVVLNSTKLKNLINTALPCFYIKIFGSIPVFINTDVMIRTVIPPIIEPNN